MSDETIDEEMSDGGHKWMGVKLIEKTSVLLNVTNYLSQHIFKIFDHLYWFRIDLLCFGKIIRHIVHKLVDSQCFCFECFSLRCDNMNGISLIFK